MSMERLNFSQLVDKVFELAIIGVALYGVNSINTLNEKIAVVIEKIYSHDKQLDRQQMMLDKLIEGHNK